MQNIIHRVPFLRFALAISAGIIAGTIFPAGYYLLSVGLLLLAVILIWMNTFYSHKLSVYFGVGVHLFFFVTGFILYQKYNQKPKFFNNVTHIAVVREMVEEKPQSCQSVLEIKGFIKNDSLIQAEEKIMVLFEKNEESKSIRPGQVIVFNKIPGPVQNNNNPFEFDYKRYLARNKIYRQVYLLADDWFCAKQHASFSPVVLAEQVRYSLLEIFSRQNWETRELEVISALTLGYKRGLQADTREMFTSAGVMHVLAVSGLHVGIVYFILTFIFGFLNDRGFGRVIYIALILLSLWSFAFITGLSPSVNRAATMFTFVVIGRNLRRQLNIYNTLAASAFFLLLINPNNIFDAGFQLSYLAVFGIVFLQPRLNKLLFFRNRIARYFWALLTVSVAAQLSTFPVAVYYFHQFPCYFWVSNMVVLPAVSVLIPLSIAVLALSWIPLVSGIIAGITGFILKYMINFLEMVEQWPNALLPVNISGLELVFIMGVMLSLFFFIEISRPVYFKAVLVFFLLFLITSLSIRSIGLFRNEIIVYNNSGRQLAHFISGRKNYVVSETAVKANDFVYNVIGNTVRGLRIDTPVYLTLKQDYSSPVLYLNKGLIIFNGKVIYFNTREQKIDSPFEPDIELGTSSGPDFLNEGNPEGKNTKGYREGEKMNFQRDNFKEKNTYRMRL